jgi:plastocyanin
MKRVCFFIFSHVFLLFTAAGGHSGQFQASAQLDVTISYDGYSPQVVTIPVNSSVTWTNVEGVHTTTSRHGFWNSGVLLEGEDYSYEFNSVGLYPYYCTISQWLLGTIKVVHTLATIEIYTDNTVYSSGDIMTVGLNLENRGNEVEVGIYIWVEFSDGVKYWVLQKPSVVLPDNFTYSNPVWLSITLPPIKRGNYHWRALLMKVPQNDPLDEDSEAWSFGRVLQTDWSEGPGEPGPVHDWSKRFDNWENSAWRAIEGQLSLSSIPRLPPPQVTVTDDAGKPNSVGVGDLNGDGQDDILSTDPVYDLWNNRGAVYWWQLLENGTWMRNTVDRDFYGAHHISTSDVDSDGDTDVVAAAFYGDGPELGRNGKYAWFENLDDAGDIWVQHDLDLKFQNANEAHAADIDGDGDLDVVGANAEDTGPSNFTWWENLDGDGSSWTKRAIPGQFWDSGYLDIGDIDNDGDLDLLGSGYNTSQVGWWENIDGKGKLWQSWYVAVVSHGRGAELRDMEGDGDLDALIWSDSQVQWIENTDGNGIIWSPRSIVSGIELPWAVSGDVDNNGKPDVIVSNEDSYSPSGEQLLWFDISKFVTTGELTSSILDGGLNPHWGSMTWSADIPAGTSLDVYVRVSNEPTDMGNFVQVPNSGYKLGLIINPDASFLQYKGVLQSEDPEYSPVLHEINVAMGESSTVADLPESFDIESRQRGDFY